MARKKTKRQKQKTRRHRETISTSPRTKPLTQGLVYSLNEEFIEGAQQAVAEKNLKQSISEDANLFEYDPKLLSSDIKKTMMISLLVFTMQIGLYLILK